jgi:hypothetical protein
MGTIQNWPRRPPGVLPKYGGHVLLKGGLATVALLVLSGCVHQPGRTLDTPQRMLVLKQLIALREMFNAGRCGEIYDNAALEFRSNNVDAWLDDCQDLRELLGSWDSFDAQTMTHCGYNMCALGIGRFSTGGWKLQIASKADGRRPRLVSMSLVFKSPQGSDVVIRYPHSQRRPRLLDPPMVTRPKTIEARKIQ